MKEQIGGHQRPPSGMEELLKPPPRRFWGILRADTSPCPCGQEANSFGMHVSQYGRMFVYECSSCGHRFKEYFV